MSKLPERPRIFVVDDEPNIAISLGLILSQDGFDATPFTDPLEALQSIRAKAPDLLISDVIMPGLSGVELAIVMREICPDCVVILFSGQIATEAILESARDRGYDFGVLAKPVHPSDMLRTVRSGLGRN